MLRKGLVKYNNVLAGYLCETETGFRFIYDENYLKSGHPISVSLPLSDKPYESEELFSFFRGLLPEGWYLDIVSTTAKIDAQDSFGILLATSGSTIGAVTLWKTDQRDGS
jgi:serine/threonine-protein kinase HipA